MKLLLPLFLLLCCLRGNAQQDATRLYTPAELQSDLDSLYSALRLNHPHLFKYRSEKDANAAFGRLRGGIDAPMTRAAFYARTMPFVSGFHDGHTYLDIDFESPDMVAFEKAGGRYFPARVWIVSDRLYLADTCGAALPGDEILKLNGRGARELVRELAEAFPADGPANARMSVERLFPYTLWLALGWGTEVKVEAETELGRSRFTVPGDDRQAMMAKLFPRTPNCRLDWYPEESLAVVTINNYNNVTKTKAFIDSAFREIKARGCRNVALDLRKNGGGSSVIGSWFLAHLSHAPQATVVHKSWRLGPLTEALPATTWISKQIAEQRSTYTLSLGMLSSPRFEPEAAPVVPDSLFHSARFFLLTGPRTYSSAHMTALTVKCSGLGTIIGEPTGERLDLTGELVSYKLPHTGIEVGIPVATYKAACGDGMEVGVTPDVRVNRTIGDLRAGRDAVLEKLRSLCIKP